MNEETPPDAPESATLPEQKSRRQNHPLSWSDPDTLRNFGLGLACMVAGGASFLLQRVTAQVDTSLLAPLAPIVDHLAQLVALAGIAIVGFSLSHHQPVDTSDRPPSDSDAPDTPPAAPLGLSPGLVKVALLVGGAFFGVVVLYLLGA